MVVCLKKLLIIYILIVVLVSCVKIQQKFSEENGQNISVKVPNKEELMESESIQVSARFKPFVNSLTNNNLTSKTVNLSKLANLESKLEKQIVTDEKNVTKEMLALLINIKRFKGTDITEILELSQKLILKIMAKGIDKDLPLVTKLDIAIAAIKNKKFSYGEYIIEGLISSNNSYVKAAALTLQGIIFLLEDKIPESVLSFNEALKVNANFEAARLNLGFLALKYGDFDTAFELLSPMSSDWFVASGLIVLERQQGQYAKAQSLCKLILSQKQDYLPALFNCAFNEWQGVGDLNKAEAYLNIFIKHKRSPAVYEDRAIMALDQVQRQKLNTKRREKNK